MKTLEETLREVEEIKRELIHFDSSIPIVPPELLDECGGE